MSKGEAGPLGLSWLVLAILVVGGAAWGEDEVVPEDTTETILFKYQGSVESNENLDSKDNGLETLEDVVRQLDGVNKEDEAHFQTWNTERAEYLEKKINAAVMSAEAQHAEEASLLGAPSGSGAGSGASLAPTPPPSPELVDDGGPICVTVKTMLGNGVVTHDAICNGYLVQVCAKTCHETISVPRGPFDLAGDHLKHLEQERDAAYGSWEDQHGAAQSAATAAAHHLTDVKPGWDDSKNSAADALASDAVITGEASGHLTQNAGDQKHMLDDSAKVAKGLVDSLNDDVNRNDEDEAKEEEEEAKKMEEAKSRGKNKGKSKGKKRKGKAQ